VVYVDDIVITSDDERGIHNLKAYIQQNFHIKDLGNIRNLLAWFKNLRIGIDQ